MMSAVEDDETTIGNDSESIPMPLLATWILEKNENLEEFLTAKGVPWLVRKMIKGKFEGSNNRRTFATNADPGGYRMTLTGGFSLEYNFHLNVPFEANGADGKKHRIVFKLKGDHLIESHEILEGTRKGAHDDTDMYIQSDGKLIAESHADKVVWKRYFKKE